MSELKPCPFCGNEKIDVAWSDEWKIACWDCGLVLTEVNHDILYSALERWNSRPIEDELHNRWSSEHDEMIRKDEQLKMANARIKELEEELDDIHQEVE